MGGFIYLSKIEQSSSHKFSQYVDLIFDTIYFLKRNYPDFKKWYYEKVVPDIKKGEREIIIKEVRGEISAVSILKDSDEKKICTFLVLPEYRNRGIGKEMLQKSIEILGTVEPIITVSSDSIEKFDHLLKEFGFRELQNLDDYYKYGVSEHVFNGSLEIRECKKYFAA